MSEEQITPLTKATDISQVRNKGIVQLEPNTFTIKGSSCFKAFPLIFFFFGLIFIVVGIFIKMTFIKVVFLILGIIFALVSICLSFSIFHTIIFVMGANTLEVQQKALLRKKVKMFQRGEIRGINFSVEQRPDDEGTMMNNYRIVISSNSGDEEIYNTSTNFESFTPEEIEYFNNYINNHIQRNMN